MGAIRDIFAIPFGWILSFFYSLTGNYLLSLLAMTIIFKLIMLPSSIKQQKGTAKQVRFQAKTKKIQEMYKGDNAKIQEETQALYRREGFNPMSAGCAPLLLQMPVIMGLYGVIYTPLKNVLGFSAELIKTLTDALTQISGYTLNASTVQIDVLHHFGRIKEIVPNLGDATVAAVEKFKLSFTLWGMDLTQKPDPKAFDILWLIPVLSLVTSMLSAVYMYIKQRQTNPEMAKNPSMGCMMLTSPLMSLYFAFIFPAGIGVYWTMSNIVAFIQTVVLNYTHNPKKLIAQIMIDETVERRSRENSVKKMKEYMGNSQVN